MHIHVKLTTYEIPCGLPRPHMYVRVQSISRWFIGVIGDFPRQAKTEQKKRE